MNTAPRLTCHSCSGDSRVGAKCLPMLVPAIAPHVTGDVNGRNVGIPTSCTRSPLASASTAAPTNPPDLPWSVPIVCVV